MFRTKTLTPLVQAGAEFVVGHRSAKLIVLVMRVVPEEFGATQFARLPQQRHEAHAVCPAAPVFD